MAPFLPILVLLTGLQTPMPQSERGLLQRIVQAVDTTHVEFVRMPEKLVIGQRVQLRAQVVDEDGSVRNDDRIAWRAQASSYVSLAADGRITAVRPGRVGILAVAGDLVAGATLEIVADDIASFTLEPAYGVTRVGEAVQVTVNVRDGQGRPITGLLAEWAISPEGATIDDEGTFLPRQTGLYTLLATIGDRKAVATVRVAPPRD